MNLFIASQEKKEVISIVFDEFYTSQERITYQSHFRQETQMLIQQELNWRHVDTYLISILLGTYQIRDFSLPQDSPYLFKYLVYPNVYDLYSYTILFLFNFTTYVTLSLLMFIQSRREAEVSSWCNG